MYRVVLTCSGIPVAEGPKVTDKIAAEFVNHRGWHRNVVCVWDGQRLVLAAENDYDEDGTALREELWDCVCALVKAPFNTKVSIQKLNRIDGPRPPKKLVPPPRPGERRDHAGASRVHKTRE